MATPWKQSRGAGGGAINRRKGWKLAALATMLTGMLLGLGYWWVASASSVQLAGAEDCERVPTASTIDEAEAQTVRGGVCAAVEALGEAWAAHDAQAYGEVFTEEATYTTFAGTYYNGRDDIVRSHEALYQGPLAGTELADRYLGLQILSNEVAVLTTRGDTYEGDQPDQLTKVQTYSLVRDNNQWKVAAFHNTQRKNVMEQMQYWWMPETVPAAER